MARTVGNVPSLLLSVAAIGIVSYGLHFVLNIRTAFLPPPLRKAGPTQFLTNLSGVLTDVYFACSLVANLIKSRRLFWAKNNYILPVVLSLEFIVTTVYWSLKLFFTHLIVMVDNVPWEVDFCLHVAPFVTLFIDYFMFLPQFEISNKWALSLCGLLAVGYWNWLEYLIDVEQGQLYPYPFLNIDRNPRIVVFCFVALLAFGGFVFMRRLYSMVVLHSPKKAI